MIMIQKCYSFYCELLQENIGDGFCCKECEKLERPQKGSERHDHQLCKYEKITKTYTRSI